MVGHHTSAPMIHQSVSLGPLTSAVVETSACGVADGLPLSPLAEGGGGSNQSSRLPFAHFPFRVKPAGFTCVPTPCCLPFCHMPTHFEPSGHVKIPGPCFLSFSYFPSNDLPSCHS